LNLEGNGAGYVNYLFKIQHDLKDIRAALENTVINWSDLFTYLEKQHKSYPKLIDEYYWITITQGCDPSKLEKFFQ
jgi:hypothetical protein